MYCFLVMLFSLFVVYGWLKGECFVNFQDFAIEADHISEHLESGDVNALAGFALDWLEPFDCNDRPIVLMQLYRYPENINFLIPDKIYCIKTMWEFDAWNHYPIIHTKCCGSGQYLMDYMKWVDEQLRLGNYFWPPCDYLTFVKSAYIATVGPYDDYDQCYANCGDDW